MADINNLKDGRFVIDTAARQWDSRTNARSDRVVLEFFFLFCSSKKEKNQSAIELYCRDDKHS